MRAFLAGTNHDCGKTDRRPPPWRAVHPLERSITETREPETYVDTKGMSKLERHGFFSVITGSEAGFSGDEANFKEWCAGRSRGADVLKKREEKAYNHPSAVAARARARNAENLRALEDAPKLMERMADLGRLDLTADDNILWERRRALLGICEQARIIAAAHNDTPSHRLTSELMTALITVQNRAVDEIQEIMTVREQRWFEAQGGKEAWQASVTATRATRRGRRRAARASVARLRAARQDPTPSTEA